MRRALTRPRDRGERGLTLVELAVAILVLALAAVAAFRTSSHAQSELAGERGRLAAEIAASNHAALLRLGLQGAQPGQIGGQPVEITTERTVTEAGLVELRILARSATGSGALMVAYVSGTR